MKKIFKTLKEKLDYEKESYRMSGAYLRSLKETNPELFRKGKQGK